MGILPELVTVCWGSAIKGWAGGAVLSVKLPLLSANKARLPDWSIPMTWDTCAVLEFHYYIGLYGFQSLKSRTNESRLNAISNVYPIRYPVSRVSNNNKATLTFLCIIRSFLVSIASPHNQTRNSNKIRGKMVGNPLLVSMGVTVRQHLILFQNAAETQRKCTLHGRHTPLDIKGMNDHCCWKVFWSRTEWH